MHTSVNWVSIGSDAGLLSIGLLGTNFSEIGIGIISFSFEKMHLNRSSAKTAAILSRGDELKMTLMDDLLEVPLLLHKPRKWHHRPRCRPYHVQSYKIRAWMCSYIRKLSMNLITHPCPDCNGVLHIEAEASLIHCNVTRGPSSLKLQRTMGWITN